MLTRLGFEVAFAQDGAEAVKIYRVARKIDQPFDLLIMDLTVAGGMGGLEALQKLLELDPAVRAIASSGVFLGPGNVRFPVPWVHRGYGQTLYSGGIEPGAGFPARSLVTNFAAASKKRSQGVS